MKVKRYTLDDIAEREGAEWTTVMTTTLPVKHYVAASDYDELLDKVRKIRYLCNTLMAKGCIIDSIAKLADSVVKD